jgi:hypothetical protein
MKMENVDFDYDLISDCCGCGVFCETGEGDDMIGICSECQDWCGVVKETY